MKKKCRGIDDFLTMSKEDVEEMYAEAAREAIAETHAAGLPTCHASDREGYRMCFLFPDGHKEYFNTLEEGNAIQRRSGRQGRPDRGPEEAHRPACPGRGGVSVSPKKKMTIAEFQALPKEEREKILGESTRAAIKRLHDAGLPSVHGDDKGVYYLYPDGRKEYIRPDKK